MIESLESRRLLAAAFTTSLSGSALTVTVNQQNHHVSIVERAGAVQVTDSESGQTASFGSISAITFKGSGGADSMFYDGNSIGAKILANGGNDEVNVTDGGTGSSSVDGGGGNDTLELVYGNQTTLSGGSGADQIYVNQGGEGFDTSLASAVVQAGNGNDIITVYGGTNTIDGGGGSDTALDFGGTNTYTNVESIQSP